ncbi:MAG TPA: DUF1254 domain-containing protein [Myxococcota bacterium]|nr:DUF1254 domain-containing protein [Myxococcota bacterium]
MARRLLAALASFAAFTSAFAPARGAAALTPAEAKKLGEEVYLYAYPLVLMDVSRAVMTAKTPANAFDSMRRFPDASSTDVVSPNADTLSSSAWLDLSHEPVVLSVPDMGKRYYLMPLLDAWTNVFSSPGTRTTGERKADFAIVGPRWKGKLPADVTPIHAPTEMVWLIGRTQTNGASDYGAVSALQDQIRLTPLSAWGKPGAAPAAKPDPTPSGVDTKSAPVDQVADMDAPAFFARFASLLHANPPAPADAPMIRKLEELGIVAGKPYDLASLGPENARAVSEGAEAAQISLAAAMHGGGDEKSDSGWTSRRNLGRYGTDYGLRAGTAWFGLGANLPEDAIYASTRADAAGQPLDGSHRYVLHFAKGGLPPARAFWSLTLYDDQQHFVANPIDRYAIGDRDPLAFAPDGALDLYVQAASPGKEKESNWLPAPEGSFQLVLRVYWPKQEMIDGKWKPPGVTAAP